MNGDWQITIWGVRGSFPKPAPKYSVFGGNTSCISASCGETMIVLDAGSGIADLGSLLSEQQTHKRLHILLSHLHLDHVLGFFSFQPLFDPDREIHIYGYAGFQKYLETLMDPPYWPVGFRDFPARLVFHEISAGDAFDIEGIKITTMAANHPNEGILYRLERGGKSLVYALDCELDEAGAQNMKHFAAGCNLLLWDANFTPEDLTPGWGHSTWKQGIDIRRSSGAKKILMTHYNQHYTDELLLRQEEAAGKQDAASLFAREGMVLTL